MPTDVNSSPLVFRTICFGVYASHAHGRLNRNFASISSYSVVCFLFFLAGSGMGKLYNDVVSCGYEDVHVMWSMLHQTHAPVESPKKHRPTVSFE